MASRAPRRGFAGPRVSRRCAGICSSGASRRARRPISARSSGERSTSSSPTTSSAGRRATCPSIPGAVIISCDEPLKFEPMPGEPSLGILKVPEREGILRAIDGQHRLLALHAGMEQFDDENFTVPAVIFDRLPEDHVVQMFVTINAKHTRLNASHLVSLSGRQLYRDENLAAAHDVVRALSEKEESPLHGEIKLLGVGRGRVAQAPLAQELKKLFSTDAFGTGQKGDEFREEAQALLRELLPAGRGRLRRGLERPQVQHQDRAGAPRLHPRRARHRARASTSSTPTAPTSAPSAASSRRGAAGSATCDSRPTAPGSDRDRRSISSRRSCGSRCSIPKARWSERPRVVSCRIEYARVTACNLCSHVEVLHADSRLSTAIARKTARRMPVRHLRTIQRGSPEFAASAVKSWGARLPAKGPLTRAFFLASGE